ncbi:Biodegradative arginine decarboxylase [Methanocorpusculaceae archaeon Sp1]|nr:Biodegradative arginine decarboxylase [Methanocorpusculaceae archaeon Sp1]
MEPTDTLSVLIIGADTKSGSAFARNMQALIDHLKNDEMNVICVETFEGLKDGFIANGAMADCVMIDWQAQNAKDLIKIIREHNKYVSIFLLTEPGDLASLPLDVFSTIDEYAWILGDTPEFIAGRVKSASRKYRKAILPPMFGALIDFSEDYEYSWHTPGHTAGTAFLKSPIGKLFYEFYGEQTFRSDLSISVGELGSLLDHSGPIGEAEQYAAKVFGSDMTFFVTNGTSTSNRVVQGALVAPKEVVFVDRNCHKSLEQAFTLDHGIPVYMIPTRNRYGILGPIPQHEMEPENLAKKLSGHPLGSKAENKTPVVAVVTNSTYDGVCYDAVHAEELLGKTVNTIHFDEAWYGYAKFNKMYAGRFGMHDDNRPAAERPTVITTQSTHKLLAALSQASMIHIKNGKQPLEHALFNESFMMHASTSPQYSIIASLDVSSKMMDMGGDALMQEAIDEAVRFRQMMARACGELDVSKPDNWWFKAWQPDTVTMPDGKKVPFESADPKILARTPSCWTLSPGDVWHGFPDMSENWAMLDPIKVTILTPGMNDDGTHAEFGIPAAVVLAYLDTRGIINEKSGDYNILFLFSMGVTKGKWGTLMSALFDFKRLFDADTPLDVVLPDLVKSHPERYGGMTLKSLAKEMHEQIKSTRQTQLANEACAVMPTPVMTPADAHRYIVKGQVEQLPVDKMANRVVATGVVPYPPGIPMLMPGENAGKADGPILMYLKTLQDFDRKFPGFAHDTHGVEAIDGTYYIYCLKE